MDLEHIFNKYKYLAPSGILENRRISNVGYIQSLVEVDDRCKLRAAPTFLISKTVETDTSYTHYTSRLRSPKLLPRKIAAARIYD